VVSTVVSLYISAEISWFFRTGLSSSATERRSKFHGSFLIQTLRNNNNPGINTLKSSRGRYNPNEAANGDEVHRLDKGILYFRIVVKFQGILLNKKN
jgi:hypothetical protein